MHSRVLNDYDFHSREGIAAINSVNYPVATHRVSHYPLVAAFASPPPSPVTTYCGRSCHPSCPFLPDPRPITDVPSILSYRLPVRYSLWRTSSGRQHVRRAVNAGLFFTTPFALLAFPVYASPSSLVYTLRERMLPRFARFPFVSHVGADNDNRYRVTIMIIRARPTYKLRNKVTRVCCMCNTRGMTYAK